MEKLTREEKRIITVLYDNLFSLERKIKMVKLLTGEKTHTYLNMNRKDEEKINEIFDSLFDYEDKIEAIKLHYQVRGFKFETVKELFENRKLLEEMGACPNWEKVTK